MNTELFKLIRPQQWVKNLFVFVPLFFAGQLFRLDALAYTVVVFVAFCFMSSAVYCYNDIIDADADRRHPVKCHRPIASGAVSPRAAYLLMAVLTVLSAATLLTLSCSVSTICSISHIAPN